MTPCRAPSIVKSEAYRVSQDNDCSRTATDRCETLIARAVSREADPLQRLSFRNSCASRFTRHERRGRSQAEY
jgi:hypothetical protein